MGEGTSNPQCETHWAFRELREQRGQGGRDHCDCQDTVNEKDDDS